MERKILTIMAALVIIAAVVVAVVMVAAGGVRSAGGFTKLFDQLENPSGVSYGQYLQLPNDWHAGDVKKVGDVIVDLYSRPVAAQEQASIYQSSIYFTYQSDKWNDPEMGTLFYVPITTQPSGYLTVNHGLFHLVVFSATDLSAHYDVGDSITLESTLIVNTEGDLAFGTWIVSGTI